MNEYQLIMASTHNRFTLSLISTFSSSICISQTSMSLFTDHNQSINRIGSSFSKFILLEDMSLLSILRQSLNFLYSTQKQNLKFKLFLNLYFES